MGVTVETPAASFNLCTISRVKDELEIADAELDEYLENLIVEASAAIAEYCGVVFPRQVYVETLGAHGDCYLVLTNTPLVGSPSEILLDSTPITDAIVDNASAGVLFRQAGWASTAPLSYSIEPRYGEPHPLVSVTYEAGYVLPDDHGTDLPQQIQRACVVTVAEWYRTRKRTSDVKSKKVGDLSITYQDSDASNCGLPLRAVALLKQRVI